MHPLENPKPGEAIVEVRLFFGDDQTRIAHAHFRNLPKSKLERAEHITANIPPLIAKLIGEYLHGGAP